MQILTFRPCTIVCALVVFILLIPMSWGQTAQVVGTISDVTGGRVPQAKVTATQVNTGTERTVTSNSEGYYIVPLLPPGNYTITVSKEGFSPVSHPNVTLGVGDNAMIDVRLAVGSVSQAVSVAALAPLVDTQSGTINRVVDQQRIVDLPSKRAGHYSIVTVQAGVLETVSSAGVVGNAFVVNGSRNTGVNFLLDGATNVNSYQNYSGEYPEPGRRRRVRHADEQLQRRICERDGSGGERGDQVRHESVPWLGVRVSSQRRS